MNILFDLDGTLTDPGDGFVACIAHALAGVGCEPPPPAQIRAHVGPPLELTLRELLGADDARIAAAVALYRQRYAAAGYRQNVVYPGVETILGILAAAGARLFVATSKPTVFAVRILEHFGLARHFEDIYGSELDGTRSNKSLLIGHLLQRERLDPRATRMVGDRAQDVAGALANELLPVGVLWGYGSREELLRAGAVVLCEQPEQLPDLICR